MDNNFQSSDSTLNNNVTGNASEILYMELDIIRTEKRFRQYAKTYNQELHNPEYLKEQFQIHQQCKAEVEESIKSLSIKNTHILTIIAIIRAYYSYLKQIKRGQIKNKPVFAMNNVGIATMVGMCSRSSQRHVNKLIAVGFLQEKIFRGTNTSYILKINPEFLVARPVKRLNDLLVSQHTERYPGIPIPPSTLKYYNSLRPSFSDYSEGMIRTVCPYVEITQDTYNNNILSKGIVDNSGNPKGKSPEKLIVINNASDNHAFRVNPDNKTPEQTNVRSRVDQSEAYQEKIRREKQNSVPATALESVFFFSELSWNFVRSLLYDNREFMPTQEQATKHHIAGYFMEYIKNNNPRTISQSYNEFITTIQIIHDYTHRKIEWQTARPEYFFDPHFTGGFYRAFKEWLPRHKEKQKKNKQWNSNKKLVAQLYRYYASDPTFERYRQCTQRLGKLTNKKFLDIFNACVLDKSKYNHQFMNQ